jgi:hypothetical protein
MSNFVKSRSLGFHGSGALFGLEPKVSDRYNSGNGFVRVVVYY